MRGQRSCILLLPIVCFCGGNVNAGPSYSTKPSEYCKTINISSAVINADIPATLDEIINQPGWKRLPPSKSIWHNLREGLVYDTIDQRMQIAAMSAYEYHFKSRDEWKYLDPNWPNVKFIEKDGHREAIYNLNTRRKVDSGINQATANFGANPNSAAHKFDVVNWIRCWTPDERQNAIGKVISENEELREATAKMMDKIAEVFELSPIELLRIQQGQKKKAVRDMSDKSSKDNTGETRKICSCASPDEFFAGVCKKKVGVIKNRLWAQYYCRNCGGFRRGSMFELRQTDKGVSVYPAGSVPSGWDGKIYEQSELEAHVRELRNSVKAERENVVEEKVNTDVNQQPRTDDSQVGIRGWCKCQKKNIDDGLAQVGPWFYDSFGREKYDEREIECDLAYFICCKCGRVVHPNDRTLRNQDLPIFDVKLYKMILAQDKNIVWRKAAVPLKKRQDHIAAIPEGQIVVHGKCVCKKENTRLVHVGSFKDGGFHVCIICGHVRSPDAIAGIPCEEGNE